MSNLNPTIYQQKYGKFPLQSYYTRHALDPNKSGLTPLGPLFPETYMGIKSTLKRKQSTNDETIKRLRGEVYQKEVLRGFTTQDLVELDVISNRQLKASTLDNPIYPILARNRWMTSADNRMDPTNLVIEYGTGPGNTPGGSTQKIASWMAADDMVWETIKPCLHLASHVLTKLPSHPWFSALLDDGTWQAIDEARFHVNDRSKLNAKIYNNFNVQTPHPDNLIIAKETMAYLVDVIFKNNLKIGFSLKDRNPTGGAAVITAEGRTTFRYSDGRMRIWLSLDLVDLLLEDGLNDAEKLALQWRTAAVLVHEIMHAVVYGLKYFKHVFSGVLLDLRPRFKEFYFAEEQIAEIGMSGEVALWGGVAERFLHDRLPLGFWLNSFFTAYPTHHPTLIDPPRPATRLSRPIPVSFFETLHTQSWWDHHFRCFGMIKPPPPLKGSQMESEHINPNADWILIDPPAFAATNASQPAPPNIQDLTRLSPLERIIWLDEFKASQIERFYKLIQEQQHNVRAIQLLANTLPRQENAEHPATMQQITPLLQKVLNIHIKAIDFLFTSLEEDTRQVDARLNLQSFNRNLRNFISYLRLLAPPDIDSIYETIHDALEIQRLRLWPADTPVPNIITTDLDASNADDIREANLITAAETAFGNGDEQTAQEICEELIGSLGANFLTKVRALVLVGKLDSVDSESRLEGLRVAEGVVNRLEISLARGNMGLGLGGINQASSIEIARLQGELKTLIPLVEAQVEAEEESESEEEVL